MKYKPDWDKVKQRYEAFWKNEIIDRAVFYVVAPKPGKKTVPVPKDPETRFTNEDYLFESGLASLEGTYWGADALPELSANVGLFAFPDCIFGGKPRYGETIWMERAFDSLADPHATFDINFANPYIIRQERYLKRICEFAREKCLVHLPSCFGGLDCLSSLLGPEQLCLELAEPTSKLRRALSRTDAASMMLYERFRSICAEKGVETTMFLPLWAPGRYVALQCDFMVMIGKQHFLEYGMPSLRLFAAFADHSLFHLDGAEATHHLDALLACEELDGIQWQPGNDYDGPAPLEPWFPMLRKIQQAGKKIYVSCEAKHVELVMKSLSSKGLFLASAANSEEEALALERLVAKLTHD